MMSLEHTPTPKNRKVEGDDNDDGIGDELGAASKSGHHSEIMDEAPKQFGKSNKVLPSIQKFMRDAVHNFVDNLTATKGQSDTDDPELQSYRRAAVFRLRLGKLWMAGKVEEAKGFITLAPTTLLVKCGIVPSDNHSSKQAVSDAGSAAPVVGSVVGSGTGAEDGKSDGVQESAALAAGDGPAQTPGEPGGVKDNAGETKDIGAQSNSDSASGKRKAPGPTISKHLHELLKSVGKHGMTVHQADNLIG